MRATIPPILTLCLAATLCTLVAGPAWADCDYQCTPESNCDQPCLGCVEEHIDYGCIRYRWTTCGQRATCNWGGASSTSPLPSFEAWSRAGNALAVATCTNGQTRWLHMGGCCEFGPQLEEQECRFGGFWMFTGETQCSQGPCSQW